MKNIILFISVVGLISSCKGNDNEINTDNISLVKKYVQAVQQKNVDAMAAMLSDDYMGYGPAFSDSINKADAIANWKNLTENLYDSIEYTRSVNFAAKVTDGPRPGDYVVDWSSLKITYKDGRGPVYLYVNAVYRIENGKITMTRTFYDEADVYRQLGYEFVPPTTRQ
jgi:limonene-1,2-epoxide hydrolase